MPTSVAPRPFVTPSLAAVTAAAVVLTPPMAPLAARAAEAAAVQFSAAVALPNLGSLTDSFATLQLWQPDLLGAAAVADATGNFLAPLGDAIENIYLTVEPWVAYGVSVAQWAVGWVPFVGLLAPQIGIFYTLGESVVQSLLFNSIDWITGQIGFLDGLSAFGSDVWSALGIFVDQQIDWITGFLPPLPPLPFGLSTTGLDLAAAAPDLMLPTADLGLGTLSALAGDLSNNLGDLLLSLVP